MRLVLLSFLSLSLISCSDANPGAHPDTGTSVDTAVSQDTEAIDAADNDTGSEDTGTADTTPMEDTTPAEDSAPKQDTTLAEDTAPDEDATPAEDTAFEDVPDDTAADAASPDTAADIQTPPLDQAIAVSNATDYESGELHGMTVDEAGRVTIFWRGRKADKTHDLLVSQSDPWVNAFEDPVVLKGDIAPLTNVGGEMLTHIYTHYFVWRDEDTTSGKGQIIFRKAEMPDLLGADVILGESDGELWRPYLVRSQAGDLCALWQRDKDVLMRCSQDDGLTWAEEINIDAPGETATVSAAAFTATSDLVVALQAGGLGKNAIRVLVSSDLGQTWKSAETVDGNAITDGKVSPADENHLVPSMAYTTTGQLKLAWHKPLPGTDAAAYLTSSVDGLNWSAPVLLPEIESHVSLKPGRGENLHASGVTADLGYGDTVYMSSIDEGANWDPAVPIPVTPNALLLSHRLRANLTEGWLHIGWWETLPNNLTKQTLKVVTVEVK